MTKIRIKTKETGDSSFPYMAWVDERWLLIFWCEYEDSWCRSISRDLAAELAESKYYRAVEVDRSERTHEPLDRGVAETQVSRDTNSMPAYGESKTYYQESTDSRTALGIALIASATILLILLALWVVR